MPRTTHKNKSSSALRKTGREGTVKQSGLLLLTAVFPLLGLSSCEIVGDIFQAGVWVGVLLVVGVIAIIVWMLSRSKT